MKRPASALDAARGEPRPRVLVVGPSAGGAGGISVVIDTLLDSELASRFELVRITTHGGAGPAAKAAHALSGFAQAAFQLFTRRVDVVYLQASSRFSFRRKTVVAELARLARRPYVIHVHAGDFEGYYRGGSSFEQRLVRRALSGAATVIALTPSWERRIQALVSCRTTSIPNPVSIPSERAKLDAVPPRIVCLGRLGAAKGSLTLVRALALLAERHSNVRMTLAGDGDLASVRAEAHRSGVADRVEIPGWIGPAERARTLLGATVFALPAREEGLPVALLEAMAYGLPAVVSPVGGIPDVFVEGRHGYFVRPDDPTSVAEGLSTLLDDLGVARRMGSDARVDAMARFATAVVATQVGDALEEALDRRRQDAPG